MTDPHPLDGIITNGDLIKRDRRDCPMVFAADHAGELDYTQGKTTPGRRGYTRTTSYVDCLDDKTNLDVYHSRNVIAGMVAEPALLADAANVIRNGKNDLDDRAVKDGLNRVANLAREAMYEDRKADTGTAIHAWCEQADLAILAGQAPGAALADLTDRVVDGHPFKIDDHRADVAAYLRATLPVMRSIAVETLVIVDDLKIAGTPDRIVEWIGEPIDPPHGPPVVPGDVLVNDTKSGNITYGLGKIAMQLAIYGNGVFYDQATNTRRPLPERIRRDWAVIVHVPAGTGTCALVWVDIAAGWDAVNNLARPVRGWRNASKKLSAPLPEPDDRARIDSALSLADLRAMWSEDWRGTDVETYAIARAVALKSTERNAA